MTTMFSTIKHSALDHVNEICMQLHMHDEVASNCKLQLARLHGESFQVFL